MLAKDDIVRAVRDQRRRTLSLLSGLAPEQFDVIALPRWRVREVVAHFITTDRASVTGGILPVVFGSTERLEAWNDRQVGRWADRSPSDLLVGLDRWGRRFVRLASAIPRPLYGVRMPTLWGRGPGGLLILGRAYDEWVHRQDIRRALELPDEEVDLAAVGEFLLTAIWTDAVPRLAGRTGRVAVSLSGAPIPEWRFDLGAGTAGPDRDVPADVRVESAGPAFIMTAAGRGTFEELESVGGLSLEGDHELGRAFLGAVRIV